MSKQLKYHIGTQKKKSSMFNEMSPLFLSTAYLELMLAELC